MKSILSYAVTLVAFSTNVFANGIIEKQKFPLEQPEMEIKGLREIVFTTKPCKITIYGKDKDGNSDTYFASGAGSITLEECDEVRKRFESDLREKGITFSDSDVTLTWGIVK